MSAAIDYPESRAARFFRHGVLAVGAALLLVLTETTPDASYSGVEGGPGPLLVVFLGFAFLLMPVLLVASWVAGGRVRIPQAWLAIPAALLVLGAAVSTALAADKASALVRSAEVAGIWIGFWALAQAIRTDAERRILLAALIAAALVAALMTGVQAAKGHPHVLASFLVLAGLVALGFAIEKRSESSSARGRYFAVVALLAAGLCAAALALAQSRAGVAAMILGVYLLGVARRVRGRRLRRALYLAPFAAAAIALAIAVHVDHPAVAGALKGLRHRLDYWQAAWPILRSRALAGVGLENFGLYYVQYRLPTAPEEVRDPHNMWISTWSQLGVAGVAALAGLMVLAVRAWRRPPAALEAARASGSAAAGALPASTEKLVGLVAAMAILAAPGVIYYFVLGPHFGAAAIGLAAVVTVLAPAEDARRLDTPNRPLGALRTACIVALVTFWVADQIGTAVLDPPTAWAMLLVLAVSLGPGRREPVSSHELAAAAAGDVPPPLGDPDRGRGVPLGTPAKFGLMLLAMLACYAYMRYVVFPIAKEETYLRLAGQSADLDGADELLREASRANPLAWEPDFWRGQTWETAAQSGPAVGGALSAEKAIAAYEAALARQPRLYSAYVGMADCLLARSGALADPQTLRDARTYLENAVRLYPTHLPTGLKLADCLYRLKEDEAAARQYERVLELDRLMPQENLRLSDDQRREAEARLRELKESLAGRPDKP